MPLEQAGSVGRVTDGGKKDKALSKNRVRKDQKSRWKVSGRVKAAGFSAPAQWQTGGSRYHIHSSPAATRGQQAPHCTPPVNYPHGFPGSIGPCLLLHSQVPEAVSQRGFLGLGGFGVLSLPATSNEASF